MLKKKKNITVRLKDLVIRAEKTKSRQKENERKRKIKRNKQTNKQRGEGGILIVKRNAR